MINQHHAAAVVSESMCDFGERETWVADAGDEEDAPLARREPPFVDAQRAIGGLDVSGSLQILLRCIGLLVAGSLMVLGGGGCSAAKGPAQDERNNDTEGGGSGSECSDPAVLLHASGRQRLEQCEGHDDGGIGRQE